MGLGAEPRDPEQLGIHLLRGPELIHVIGAYREAVNLALDWGIAPQRLLHVAQPQRLRGLRGGLFLVTPSWGYVASFGPAREIQGILNTIEAAARHTARSVVTDDGFRVIRIKLIQPEGLPRTRIRR